MQMWLRFVKQKLIDLGMFINNSNFIELFKVNMYPTRNSYIF